MNGESAKFEAYRKKLQGVCDENNLVYTLRKDKYPITLAISTTGGMDGQLTMLENAEVDGFRSPDARLVFFFKDGALSWRISDTFTISDTLFSKLKNLYKNLHFTWLQFFHREIVESGIIENSAMPTIDDEDDAENIVDDSLDEARSDLDDIEIEDEGIEDEDEESEKKDFTFPEE
jgi:hypothetical protein